MLPKEGIILNTLTPKIKLAYTDIKLVSETEYCQTFDAIFRADNQKYTIRTLNITSEFYKDSPNIATSFFIQELLRLCTKFPDAVIIESFESHEKGQLACAIKHCQSLQQLIEEDKSEAAKTINFDLMLKNVLSDVKFLLSKLRLSQMLDFELQSIYQFSELKGYFLSDWAKNLGKNTKIETTTMQEETSDGSNEVYKLGLTVLELNGTRKQDIEDVVATRSAKLHNSGIDNLLSELNQSDSLKRTLRSMLDKDLESRAKLESLIEETEGNMPVLEEEKKENLISGPRFLKVVRFGKIDPKEHKGYSLFSNGEGDGIGISVSKSILMVGIGLYIPTKPNSYLMGAVSVFQGSALKGKKVTAKEIKFSSSSPLVVNNIYKSMFDEPVVIEAETKYTIHLYLMISSGKWLFGGSSYWGAEGKSSVEGEGGIVFTFTGVFGKGRSNENEGQIPEIYYMLKN